MINVAALTAGRFVPSSRFRVRQYIEPLRSLGVTVEEHRPRVEKYSFAPNRALRPLWRVGKVLTRIPLLVGAWGSDVVWIERDLIAGYYSLERFLPRDAVLDVDDAIWMMGRPGYSERIASRCRGVIAGNSFIAEHYRGICENVWLVPTSVDTELWKPRPRARRSEWVIGWIGTASNLGYLKWIEEPLAAFLSRHEDARLLVVCDMEPEFKRIPRRSWSFERWSEAREENLVHEMDLGLMPLPDIEWAKGKCGAKMVQYMAAGLPVLVSPVGTGADILASEKVGLAVTEPEGWASGLETFYRDRDLGQECGRRGREVVERSYSLGVNAPRLAQIFATVAGGGSL